MEKREQKFCTQLGKWWDNVGYKKFDYNINIEAKVSVGTKSLNFKGGFKPHQIPTMIKYNNNPMHWKISDIDTLSTKHYDMSCTNPRYIRGVIAMMWIRPGNKKFYIIFPEDLDRLISTGIKSLDEGMANVIAYLVDEVK